MVIRLVDDLLPVSIKPLKLTVIIFDAIRQVNTVNIDANRSNREAPMTIEKSPPSPGRRLLLGAAGGLAAGAAAGLAGGVMIASAAQPHIVTLAPNKRFA